MSERAGPSSSECRACGARDLTVVLDLGEVPPADHFPPVLAYRASRAVALFSRAGINSRLLAAVGDASVAQQGRRMPGTDIPIVSPKELEAARLDRVLLTIPDLLPELRARFLHWDSHWKVEV